MSDDATNRFLSVLFGEHHANLGGPPGTCGLVLEYESRQWVLYHLDAENEIISAMPDPTLEDAFSYALVTFEVRRDEWVEDFDGYWAEDLDS